MSIRYKKLLNIKSDIIFRVLISILPFFLFAKAFRNDKFLIAIIVCMDIFCIYKSRKNDILLVLMIFMAWSNWSILAYFWLHDLFIYQYEFFFWVGQFPDTLECGLNCIYIMNAVIFSFFPNARKGIPMKIIFIENNRNAGNIVWVFIFGIGLLLLWRFLLLFRTGIYTESVIFEYIILLFILGYYFSNNKIIRGILSTLLIINVLFIVINGDRAGAITLTLAFFVILLNNKIPRTLLCLGGLIAIIGMNAIGMWRNLTSFNLGFIQKSISTLLHSGFVLDTAYAAGASGLIIEKFAWDCSIVDRLILFGKYIISIFLGSSIMGEQTNLIWLSFWKYPYHQGGGLLPAYGYFYLGYIGVILLGIIVSAYIHIIANINEKSNGLHKCISVYIVATTANWYLYSPSPLLRGTLLLTVLYLITIKFKVESFSLGNVKVKGC